VYFKEILYIIGSENRNLLTIILLFLLLSVLEVISLGLIAPYISLVIDNNAMDGWMGDMVISLGITSNVKHLLVYFGLIMLIIFTIKTLLIIWTNKKIIYFSNNLRVKTSSHLMHAYQSLEYIDYLNRNSSEYIHGINNLTSKFANVVLLLLRTTGNVIVGIFIIGMLIFQNPLALLLMLVLILLLVVLYDLIFKNKMLNYGQEVNKYSTLLLKEISEGMRGFKEIRVINKESYFYNNMMEVSKKHALYSSKSQVISTIPRFLLELLMIVFIVGLVIISLITDGDLKTLAPTLVIFGVAAIRLIPSVGVFSNTLAQLRYNKDSISILYNDIVRFKEKESLTMCRESQVDNSVFRELVLNNISFYYENPSLKSLKNISLKISSGESIGFIGKSGAGKTTLIDVLLGLLKPQSGSITYNEVSLENSLDTWLSNVAYLPQQTFLIDDTLQRNIALGVNDKDIDNERLKSSILQSNLYDFVSQLPNGLQTVIGDSGIRLSGGQRQRIALARAFYHNRNVLVMDESTSALDPETEKEIVKEIKFLKGKKTTIVITHKLTTLRNCDRIYQLKDGQIFNVGTYKEAASIVNG